MLIEGSWVDSSPLSLVRKAATAMGSIGMALGLTVGAM